MNSFFWMEYRFNIPRDVSSKPFVSGNLFHSNPWDKLIVSSDNQSLLESCFTIKLFRLCDTRTLLFFYWFSNSCNANTLIYSFCFWSWNQIKYTVVCLSISFSKNLCHVETIQLICIETQLTGLYMTRVFTELNFRKDFNFK